MEGWVASVAAPGASQCNITVLVDHVLQLCPASHLVSEVFERLLKEVVDVECGGRFKRPTKVTPTEGVRIVRERQLGAGDRPRQCLELSARRVRRGVGVYRYRLPVVRVARLLLQFRVDLDRHETKIERVVVTAYIPERMRELDEHGFLGGHVDSPRRQVLSRVPPKSAVVDPDRDVECVGGSLIQYPHISAQFVALVNPEVVHGPHEQVRQRISRDVVVEWRDKHGWRSFVRYRIQHRASGLRTDGLGGVGREVRYRVSGCSVDRGDGRLLEAAFLKNSQTDS